jgi:NADPH:quinone reductase-like Zn-dependent oxidoreductase
MAELLAAGQLDIPVTATYPLEDAASALAQAVGGGGGGAVALRP